MNRMVRASMLAGAAALLSSIVPASHQSPSAGTPAAETMAMLDPIARASSLCGTRGESMLRRRLAVASLFAAPAEAAVQAPMPLFAGVEGLRFPVSTTSEQARRYFQQGMMLSYGFNHAAAIASFRAAQRLDPACALCWWGEAVAHGPNINAPMDPAAIKPTLAALAKAQSLRGGATPAEQALIDAAAVRYSADPKAAGADRVLSVDLHAGQIQGFFDIPTDNLYAAPVMSADIQARFSGRPITVVSPDVGGVVRARALAKRLDNAPLAIVDKRRERPGESEVMNIIGDVSERFCILVDDIVDSAGTLANAADALKQSGAEDVVAYCTHGVLSGAAVSRVDNSALRELVITDSIGAQAEAIASGKIRLLTIAPLLAEAIRRIADESSVSSLFD